MGISYMKLKPGDLVLVDKSYSDDLNLHFGMIIAICEEPNYVGLTMYHIFVCDKNKKTNYIIRISEPRAWICKILNTNPVI